MWTLLTVSLIAWVVVVGGAATDEWATARSIDHLRAGHRFDEAMTRCEQLSRTALFHARREVAARCELVLYDRLTEQIAAKNFIGAVALVNRIVDNDVKSGVASSVRARAARLPDDHLDWIEELANTGRAERALREITVAGHLYPTHQGLSVRLHMLEADARLALARRRVEEGDGVGAASELARLDPDVSIGTRARALALIDQAVALAPNHYGADVPGLVRYLARVAETVAPQPYLAERTGQLAAAEAERVFGVTGLGQVTLHASPARTPGPSWPRGLATLGIRNTNGHTIATRLLGPDVRGATIPPGARSELTLPAGEYVQLVVQHAPRQGRASVKPSLAIVGVSGTVEQSIGSSGEPIAGRAGSSG